jgi:pimeloyl-ACP methyl ester carboxylesterase
MGQGPMTVGGDRAKPRILLVPGGASTVRHYFPELQTSLGSRATVIEVDPPGIGTTSDHRPLRLTDCAHGLARAVRGDGEDPVVVVAHSFGGLVALRLAIDEPDLVAGLLLLDPTALTPPSALRFMAGFLRVVARLGPVGRRMWNARARRDLSDVSMSSEQEQALLVYTDPSFVAETARWSRYLVRDGATLASDVGAGKLGTTPTIVISADEHSPTSVDRRAHEHLVASIPDAELQVWENTRHPLHIQQPTRVVETVLALLERA